MDLADDIWNRAALGGGTRAGDLALSSVLRLHGLAMSGGLLDAIERLTPAEAESGRGGLSVAGAGTGGGRGGIGAPRGRGGALDDDERAEALELRTDEEYGHVITSDDTLESAFRTRLAAEPDAFSST